MTQNKARDVKLVAAGDGSVGKTCLLMTYAYNKFSEGYVPTVFDTYDMELLVEGQSISRKFLLNIFLPGCLYIYNFHTICYPLINI